MFRLQCDETLSKGSTYSGAARQYNARNLNSQIKRQGRGQIRSSHLLSPGRLTSKVGVPVGDSLALFCKLAIVRCSCFAWLAKLRECMARVTNSRSFSPLPPQTLYAICSNNSRDDISSRRLCILVSGEIALV